MNEYDLVYYCIFFASGERNERVLKKENDLKPIYSGSDEIDNNTDRRCRGVRTRVGRREESPPPSPVADTCKWPPSTRSGTISRIVDVVSPFFVRSCKCCVHYILNPLFKTSITFYVHTPERPHKSLAATKTT